MSKESYFSKRIRKAFHLLCKDIWMLRYVIFVLITYVLIGKYFLYSICPVVLFTGFPCPGCGMTRAVFAVLRGNFRLAWKLHPFVYVLGGYALVFAVQRYLLQKEVKSMIKYLLIIAAAMVVFYLYRMIRFFPEDAPMNYYYGNVLYRIIMK